MDSTILATWFNFMCVAYFCLVVALYLLQNLEPVFFQYTAQFHGGVIQ